MLKKISTSLFALLISSLCFANTHLQLSYTGDTTLFVEGASSLQLSVTNVGVDTVVLSNPDLPANINIFYSAKDNCAGKTLESGKVCTFTVDYRPLTAHFAILADFSINGVDTVNGLQLSSNVVALNFLAKPFTNTQPSGLQMMEGYGLVAFTLTNQTAEMLPLQLANLPVDSRVSLKKNAAYSCAFGTTDNQFLLAPFSMCNITFEFISEYGNRNSIKETIGVNYVIDASDKFKLAELMVDIFPIMPV